MYVPTADLVCQGLNAPALLSRFPLYAVQEWGPESAWVSRPMLGLYGGDVFFLAGVIVVWFLVGRALDRRRTARALGKSRVIIELAKHSFLLAVGAFLLLGGILDFSFPYFSNMGYSPERALLTLIWSVSLLFISCRGFVRAIRHRWATQREGGNGA